jgi:DNA-binding MarR family transcriptional regulator
MAGARRDQDAAPPELDRLIHEPARLAIMANLFVVDSADFVFLLNRTRLTNGNLSSHMSKIEAAGYVEVTKEFVDRKPRTMYRLTRRGRAAFNSYRQALLSRLEAAEGEPGTEP